MDMKLPFSTTGMMLHLDDSMDYEVLSSSIESMPKSDKTEDEIVLDAMAHPIGSPKLSELAKGKENISDAKSKIKEYLNSKKCKNIEEAVEENLNVPVEVADEATSLETEEVKESN